MAGFIWGATLRAIRASSTIVCCASEDDVPFKSHATATYRGETVGLMQAFGQDSDTAMLMGIAQVLAKGGIRSNSAMPAVAPDYLESQAGESGTGQ